jgi:hypothetical protein
MSPRICFAWGPNPAWKLSTESLKIRMLQPVPADEETDPVKVSFLSAEAIVQITGALLHLIEQAR